MSTESRQTIQVAQLLPKEIVEHLNKYVIGQDEAKKQIAIAIRNRYRRSLLPKEIQEEISPSNMIMIGPTGVGKTEIVRRVSKILGTPFVKVEATKFTEVGYVGRDVESMIRDLLEASIRIVREEKIKQVQEQAKKNAMERLIDLLVPKKKKKAPNNPFEMLLNSSFTNENSDDEENDEQHRSNQKVIFKEKLRRHELDDQVIDIEVEDKRQSSNDMLAATGMDQVMDDMNQLMKNVLPGKKKKRRVTVSEAHEILTEEEAEKLIEEDILYQEAIELAENHGIIFIDEIDKIAESNTMNHGAGVSREGVQRDILPIVEGSVIKTKYGNIKTDYILFIAAGAFHVSQPEDLIPELQGRFPVRVNLDSLSETDFIKILSDTEHSLPLLYKELLAADQLSLLFTKEGIAAIAKIAYDLNQNEEDIGARRLTSVMEKVLSNLLFEADGSERSVLIDEDFVEKFSNQPNKNCQLDKYIL